MQQYLSLVQEVLDNGIKREDRTGTGTISIFGVQRKYDLREGFPLLTTKKVLLNGVLRELLWFLRGSTNINDNLTQHSPIWDAWADKNGELGPVYGFQWRHWGAERRKDSNGKLEILSPGIDQIQTVLDQIKNTPESRRIIVNAWNVADLNEMALPPCHLLFQFYVAGDRLDCQLYQRSADIALGVPFNIASYSALMHMVAQECSLKPGIFTHTIGDAHIYLDHLEGIKEQLTRKPLKLPQLHLANKPFWDLEYEDFTVEGYEHHPFIKFNVSV